MSDNRDMRQAASGSARAGKVAVRGAVNTTKFTIKHPIAAMVIFGLCLLLLLFAVMVGGTSSTSMDETHFLTAKDAETITVPQTEDEVSSVYTRKQSLDMTVKLAEILEEAKRKDRQTAEAQFKKSYGDGKSVTFECDTDTMPVYVCDDIDGYGTPYADPGAATAPNPELFVSEKVQIGETLDTNIKAGDQSGKEVYYHDYKYKKGEWSYCIRANFPSTRLMLADAMTKICDNDNVGCAVYPAGLDCYYEAEKVGWDVSRISGKTSTHRMYIAGVCLRAAGLEEEFAPADIKASNIWSHLKKKGGFKRKALPKQKDLLPGDILVKTGKNGRIAIVTKSPNRISLPAGTQVGAGGPVGGFEAGVVKWVDDTVALQKYSYKIFDNYPGNGFFCPICNPGTGDGWNCIGFSWASWHHGGRINSKCDNSVVHNDAGDAMYYMSEAEASAYATELSGVPCKVIKNGGNAIPESMLRPADIILMFDGDTYMHSAVYLGANRYGESSHPGALVSNDGVYSSPAWPVKIAIRYAGGGSAAGSVQPPELAAKSACIYKVSKGTEGSYIFEKNMDEHRAQASTTKLMTASLLIDSGKLDKTTTISSNTASTPQSYGELVTGDKWSNHDLMYALMLLSANDSAVAIAESVSGNVGDFVSKMNSKAKELGLNDTVYKNPHGLDQSGHYSTARDVAKLTAHAYTYPEIRETWLEQSKTITSKGRGISWSFDTTDLILGYDDNFKGGKTGTQDDAGFCFAGVYEYNGETYVTVVLGCDSEDERWADTKKLHEYIKGYTGSAYAGAGVTQTDMDLLTAYSVSLANTELTFNSDGNKAEKDSALRSFRYTDINGKPVKTYWFGEDVGKINYEADLRAKVRNWTFYDRKNKEVTISGDSVKITMKELPAHKVCRQMFGVNPWAEYVNAKARPEELTDEEKQAAEEELDKLGEDEKILEGESILDKIFDSSEVDTSDWKLLLVNNDHAIPDDYEIELTNVEGHPVDKRIANSLKKMLSDCEKAGHNPKLISWYRTQKEQEALYAAETDKTLTAKPGHSEHQTGLAVDIVDANDAGNLTDSQADNETQKWLMKNCQNYGFILRYPKNKTGITEIGYEPWHYRYVGKANAKKIMSEGLCLEEYVGAAGSASGDTGEGNYDVDEDIPEDITDKTTNAEVIYSMSKNTAETLFTGMVERNVQAGNMYTGGPMFFPLPDGSWTQTDVFGSYESIRNGRAHGGVDLGAATGTPIYSATAGTVKSAGPNGGYGNCVVISSGNMDIYYGHMSSIEPLSGFVNAGQKIGEVGSTGNSTGPHLHFEIRIDGSPTDPAPYLGNGVK